MNDTELQKMAITRVNEVIKILNEKETSDKWKIQPNDLSIIFTIKGKIGGWSCYSTKTLNFNLYLMENNIDEYMKQVIPHEVCHLFVSKKFPKASPHGWEWKIYMQRLNLNPMRCHNMDTSIVPTQIGKIQYEYKCTGCGHLFQLSKTIHNKILQGQRRVCGNCKHSIVFMGIKENY
jgi:SprT protein